MHLEIQSATKTLNYAYPRGENNRHGFCGRFDSIFRKHY